MAYGIKITPVASATSTERFLRGRHDAGRGTSIGSFRAHADPMGWAESRSYFLHGGIEAPQFGVRVGIHTQAPGSRARAAPGVVTVVVIVVVIVVVAVVAIVVIVVVAAIIMVITVTMFTKNNKR